MRHRRSAFPKGILVIGLVLGFCTLLVAEDPGGKTYEVTVSVVTPGGTFPVACTCLSFDALDGQQTACLRSSAGLLAVWGFSNLDLVPGITEVQATTGVALPSRCKGPRAGFEGIALHGTVDGTTIDLEAITELAPNLRLLKGFENAACSLETCQINP